jgi:hypothetical protein
LQDTFEPDIVRNPAYREALIEISIVINAALAYTVQQEMESNNPCGLRAAYGVYLLDARQVWTPRRGTAIRTGLADPRNNLSAFVELVDDVPGKPTLVESVICCPPRRRWSARSDDRPDVFEGAIVHLLPLGAHPCLEMTNMRTAGFGAKLPFTKRGIS